MVRSPQVKSVEMKMKQKVAPTVLDLMVRSLQAKSIRRTQTKMKWCLTVKLKLILTNPKCSTLLPTNPTTQCTRIRVKCPCTTQISVSITISNNAHFG